jgi:hypothetical protein
MDPKAFLTCFSRSIQASFFLCLANCPESSMNLVCLEHLPGILGVLMVLFRRVRKFDGILCEEHGSFLVKTDSEWKLS